MVCEINQRRIGLVEFARQDHVDAIIGQDEPACAGIGGDGDGDRAHARRKDRSHEAGGIAMHDRGIGDRLARDDAARARPCLSPRLFTARRLMRDEGRIHRRGRPFFPAHLIGASVPDRARDWNWPPALRSSAIGRAVLASTLGVPPPSMPRTSKAAPPAATSARPSTIRRWVFIASELPLAIIHHATL